VNRPPLNDIGTIVFFFAGSKVDFSFLQRNQTETLSPPSSYPGDTTVSFVVGKVTGTWNGPLSNTYCHNAWMYATT